MGISLREFWVAMDMLGTAKLSTTDHRFEDGKVSYFVNGQEFVHSGSQYVYMPKGDKITKEFKKKVLQEFNLTQPNDEKNLVVGGICSVEALLTIALMLEGRYSKELVETLTNKTYQRIFEVFKVKEFNVTEIAIAYIGKKIKIETRKMYE